MSTKNTKNGTKSSKPQVAIGDLTAKGNVRGGKSSSTAPKTKSGF